MKRFHVHVGVADLERSIRFYTQLFAAQPAVVKPDYAKWMLDDPRINFAISRRGSRLGVNHLGLQTDTGAELTGLEERLRRAGGEVVAEKDVACCYARSDKYWVTDPEGIAWESFHSLGAVPYYGGGEAAAEGEAMAGGGNMPNCCGATPAAACCSPAAR